MEELLSLYDEENIENFRYYIYLIDMKSDSKFTSLNKWKKWNVIAFSDFLLRMCTNVRTADA